jgi:hypothetical protein
LAEFPPTELSNEHWALFVRVEHSKKNVFIGQPENEDERERAPLVRTVDVFLPGDTVIRFESSQ